MTPVVQRIVSAGDDGGIPGDCVKACIASIFELPYEAVPHFANGEVLGDDGQKLGCDHGIQTWLDREGYVLHVRHRYNGLSVDEMTAYTAELAARGETPLPGTGHLKKRPFPDYHHGYWMASVMSENFVNATHAIVMLDDKVAHDPSPKPRRTPYEYVGGMIFIATDPKFARRPRVTRTVRPELILDEDS